MPRPFQHVEVPYVGDRLAIVDQQRRRRAIGPADRCSRAGNGRQVGQARPLAEVLLLGRPAVEIGVCRRREDRGQPGTAGEPGVPRRGGQHVAAPWAGSRDIGAGGTAPSSSGPPRRARPAGGSRSTRTRGRGLTAAPPGPSLPTGHRRGRWSPARASASAAAARERRARRCASARCAAWRSTRRGASRRRRSARAPDAPATRRRSGPCPARARWRTARRSTARAITTAPPRRSGSRTR